MTKQPDAEDNTNVTYQFTGEDHTLGNALRYMLMKDPDVEFAGYTIPHPSEPQMNVRVQVHAGTTTDAVVEKALDNISAVCDH
ncbi:RPC19, partial [Symbiodinium sp. CCMP2456]